MTQVRFTLALGFAFLTAPAMAATLVAGPGQTYKQPSEAIAAAKPGDTVAILPGDYLDCAVVHQNNLTIEGRGDAAKVVMSDKTCAGKGILVIDANDVTVRNMTLARAAVADRNGAGIRAEGGNLLVDGVRLINNENGILTNADPKATITILNSTFIGNGACDGACAHGLYVGDVKKLIVKDSVFRDTHHAHMIKSRAADTEIIGNTIEDGPTGNSSYLIDIPNGGGLLVQNNTMEKGPNAENHTTAIMIGEEGVTHLSPRFIIKDNRFTNDLSVPTYFVDNITRGEAILTGNVFKGKVKPLGGLGSVH